MSRRAVVTLAVLFPVLAAGQPKSAIEFYDSTGVNAKARFGWTDSAGGKAYIQAPVGQDGIALQGGNLSVPGAVSATSFSGSGSSLTGVAMANHTHTISQIAPNGIAGSDIQDSAVTSAKIRNGTIVDADISAGAQIAGSKIVPTFGADSSVAFDLGSPNVKTIDLKCKSEAGVQQVPYHIEVHNFEQLGTDPNLKTSLSISWGSPSAGNAENVAAFFASAVGPVRNLSMPGDAYIGKGLYTSGGVCCSSDRRLKCNIAPITDALNKVARLEGVTFDWDHANHPERSLPEGRQVGLIAQEVEAVLPEAVETDYDGYKMLKYDRLVALLVQAVNEQSAKIRALEDRVDSLSPLGGPGK